MAWIESHQALGAHPKTLEFASELRCGMPAAVGYLHYLWWWALDFAPEGQFKKSSSRVVAKACYFSGSSARFVDALLASGFIEDRGESWAIHDWMDYAGRLFEKREAHREHMRSVRTVSAQIANGAHTDTAPLASRARATGTNQPELGGPPPPSSPTNQPTNRPDPPGPPENKSTLAGGPSVAPPRAAATKDDDDPAVIHAEAGVCPLCRVVYTGAYIDHTAIAHAVRPSADGPGNLGGSMPKRGKGAPPPVAPTPEMEAEFEAMHRHLQELPRE